MVKSVLDKIYSSEIYTNYLRYNPNGIFIWIKIP